MNFTIKTLAKKCGLAHTRVHNRKVAYTGDCAKKKSRMRRSESKNAWLMHDLMNFDRMTTSWRECKHSAIDQEVMQDRASQNILRNCGLFKFFKMPNMKSNVRLLEMLVNYWEPDQDCFIIDQMPIRIEVEDIYFITGLSQRGKPVDLHEKPLGGLTVEDYVHVYCV